MSAAGVARRLRSLRLRAEIPPPYLLVGHSLGSLFVQHYAARYRSEVAGLVLVDPMTSDCFRTACIVKDYSHGGLHWDPFSAASREFAAIGTTQILVRHHPVTSDMPILVVTALALPERRPSGLPSVADVPCGAVNRRYGPTNESAIAVERCAQDGAWD
jgi:pimeloyl-ACP methyl ester carboxylesterase